jgi:hypothetical protein
MLNSANTPPAACSWESISPEFKKYYLDGEKKFEKLVKIKKIENSLFTLSFCYQYWVRQK